MSDPARKHSAEVDTTILSLEEFVQAQSSSVRPPDDSTTEWPTMFFVKAASEACRQSPKPVVNPKDTGPLPPASILGIVSFCYAKGVYAAEDIERKLLRDPAVRAACGNEVPRASAIRRFRRLNSETILAMLERFFRRVRRRSSARVRAQTDSVSVAAPAVNTPIQEDNTGLIARNEAVSRLERAALLDDMST